MRYNDTVETKFLQDEAGVWWCYATKHNRNRSKAKVGKCESCGEEFVSRTKQRFCSYACKNTAACGPKTERICPQCGGAVVRPGGKYCSHRCASLAKHKQGAITTPKTAANSVLLNVDNPRYSIDDVGQWWYKPIGTKDHPRTRAYILACERCGGKYLANIFHRKKVRYCSHSCGSAAASERNAGKYVGPNSGRWSGGRRMERGYVLIWAPNHPSPHKVGDCYMFEHRLVMESVLGRMLRPDEHVHHKNRIKDDNRPENLELWVGGHPPGGRAKEQQHCPTCSCFNGKS